jgi:hypothetical protein
LDDYGVEEARYRAVVEVLRILFGLRSVRGLADILSGSVCLEIVSQELLLDPKKFAVVPAPPDSAQLLKPKRVSRFLGRVCERFDCVLRTSCSGLAPDTQVLPCGGPIVACRGCTRTPTGAPLDRAYATQKP